MKILHINSYYVKDFFYTNLYNYQKENGIEFDILVHKAKNTYNDFNKEDCITISPYSKIDKYFFIHKHNKIYNKIKQLDLNYDLVHAHTLFTNGMCAYKLYKEFNIDYIVAVRSTDLNIFYKYFPHLRSVALNILLNAKKIVFISKCYLDKLLRYINKKYHNEILEKAVVIPNGINEYFLENKETSFNEKNDINLLSVARINKNKNAMLIVKAINNLRSQGYDVKLKLIGKVEDEKLLMKLLKYDFVTHYSFMGKEKLISFYKEATIFVLPSITETYGISYLEAMSQGLPVIYTRGEGFDKQFDDWFIGVGNSSSDYIELSDNILKILDNYEELRRNAINSVDDFNWNNIGKKYIDIYNDIRGE